VALVLALAVWVLYGRITPHVSGALYDQVVRPHYQEADIPRAPDASDVRYAPNDSPSLHVLTYTTDSDTQQLGILLLRSLRATGWICGPDAGIHADHYCRWTGKEESLPWDLWLQQHVQLGGGGTSVQIAWGRVPNRWRFPVYPGAHITQYGSIHCIDYIPPNVDPEEYCGGHYGTAYVTSASPEQVQAFYRELLPLCGGDWGPNDPNHLRFLQGGGWWRNIRAHRMPDGQTAVEIN